VVAEANRFTLDHEPQAGARGVWVSVTLAGPPERITALGCMRARASSALLTGTISE